MMLACVGRSPVVSASVISEIFLAGAGSSTPDAVELDGLRAIGRSTVDLVVLDASAYLGPLVRQVVTLPTDSDTLLISETPWPAELWSSLGEAPNCVTLADLAAGSNWSFTQSRTLLLLDRETDLVANYQPLATQLHLLRGAQPLDWITFQRVTAAKAWNGETPIDLSQGHALSRPRQSQGWLGPAIAGTPDLAGDLTGHGWIHHLTPGWSNGPLVVTHNPEPATAALILAGGALFYRRRRPIMPGYAR